MSEIETNVQCPHCDEQLILSPEQIRSIWGQYTSSLSTPHAGPGRPRSEDRCPCGKFTKPRAEARNHVCEAPKRRTRRRSPRSGIQRPSRQ